MTFTGIHHIVLRVHDLEASTTHWQKKLGIHVTRFGENSELGVKQAFFELRDGGFIELVAPLSSDSDIAKLLEVKGEGVQLISMTVGDPALAASELTRRGATIIGQEDGPFFVHPKSASGVMLGLAEG